MDILVLHVLHAKTLKPFGKVEIREIVQLSASNSIDRSVFLRVNVMYTCDFVCCDSHSGVYNKPMTAYTARCLLMIRSSLFSMLSSV